MGDIGEEIETVELEPLHTPAPKEAPVPEKVPA